MHKQQNSERGISVIMVAAGLTAFLGFLALVIDLGMLYSARSDAQKAADAAALAGAKYFIDQPTLPASLDSAIKDKSRAFAQAVGAENKIRGTAIQTSEITVQDSDIQRIDTASGPVFRVTAKAERQGLTTFFANALGIAAVNVSAVATADASRPDLGGTSGTPPAFNTGAQCLKPWILENHSPLDPARGFDRRDLGTMVYLHDDGSINGPSKWGIIAPCLTYTPPPAEPCDGGNSSPTYENNIRQCNPNTYYCSTGVYVADVPGNKVNATQEGVRDLIHMQGQQTEGVDNGQDLIVIDSPGPGDSFAFHLVGGNNNPQSSLRGQNLGQGPSNSIVVVPVTNTQFSNGQDRLPIDGFLTLFITQIHPRNAHPNAIKNQIDAYLIGFDPCQPSGPGGTNGLPDVGGTAGSGTRILRLVR